MPDYVMMITTLGGMAVLGVNGFVVGPVAAAMFIVVWPWCFAGTGPRRRGHLAHFVVNRP